MRDGRGDGLNGDRAGVRAALLTAVGRGAIAVIGVWGDGAEALVARVFRAAERGRSAKGRRKSIQYGRMGSGIGDEVVVCRGSAASIEIQCHGGSAAVDLVLASLEGVGVEIADATTWNAFNEPRVLSRQAYEALARASTLRAAEILADQAAGALEAELRGVDGLLNARGSQCVNEARERLNGLIARGRLGVKLASGWNVVLAGRPNVGKSSLLNALVGFDRAIVHETPGTTRDAVVTRIACDGWPVDLCDTAGLRESGDGIEAEGISRARSLARDADLVLLLLDGSVALTRDDRELMEALPNARRIRTKGDLGCVWRDEDLATTEMAISARTGDGIERLVSAIGAWLVPVVPHAGEGVPFLDAHVAALHEVVGALSRGDGEGAAHRIRAMADGGEVEG